MSQTATPCCGCSASSKPESATYYIDKMDCRNEEALIRQSLNAFDGVSGLEFDLKNRILVISHTLPTLDQVEDTLRSIGMPAQRQEDHPIRTRYTIENMDCRSEEALIRTQLEPLQGVRDLEFDLPQRSLAITHAAAALQPIEAALAGLGMRAQRMDAAHDPLPSATSVRPTLNVQAANVPLTGEGTMVAYRIENMDCPTEEALIRNRLSKVTGVVNLEFNLMQRVLTVGHTLPSAEPIEQALAAIGMKAQRQGAAVGATTVLQIAKMDCPTEEGLIRGKLEGMPGIIGLQFNLMQRTLTVEHSPEAIGMAVKAVESLGYETLVQTTNAPRDPSMTAEKTNWLPMVFSGVAAVLAEVVYWA
ncbi:MAG: cation transporter, partial [Burkholderiaceae bacterium]|nr:cation transporter [Burkholderiaceae bacterium]